MSNKKNILTVSDTENASYDSFIEQPIPEKIQEENETQKKKVYHKKSLFTDEELEQLTFLSKLEKFEEDVNNQIEIVKRLRIFAKEIKQCYQQDIIKIKKMRRQKTNSGETGFNKKCVLPNKMCELIGVPNSTSMTTPEYTSQVYQELKKRNLVYDKDKRIYRVDKQFSEILGIKDSVNKSITYPDEKGLNIGTMQTYINDALKKYKENTETKIKVSKTN
jgi:chromatin remodeling complex protein RSC6